jgi:hypothetical protein
VNLTIGSFGFVSGGALVVFAVFWLLFRLSHKPGSYFFDPQDTFRNDPNNWKLPLSAATATFEPMLKHYIGVTQLLVTVAAASIAFGGGSSTVLAKTVLAWSIFYGVVFCALLLWRYDEYAQNVGSYTLGWYSTIYALGFSSLVCFFLGYLMWCFALW